ncbi:MAG: pyridoxal-phosphate dependent enzyme, partial [bacterium]|nr:pyridoxal-phosphate dependent enzyme [bacterium]
LKAFFIPEGASSPLGCWGYIETMEEISKYEQETNTKFDTIFVATGSAGTYAGLLLGKYLTNSNVNIIGFNIYSAAKDFSAVIKKLCKKTIAEYELDVDIDQDDIMINNDYLGEGYALTDDQQLEKILSFARLEGIILDHVYTGKAMIGMQDLLARYPEKYGENILFIHTGGLFGLFPIRDKIAGLSKDKQP